MRGANATLGDHQKIRAAALWTGPELPRTEGTRKLKRRELKNWVTTQSGKGRTVSANGHRPKARAMAAKQGG